LQVSVFRVDTSFANQAAEKAALAPKKEKKESETADEDLDPNVRSDPSCLTVIIRVPQAYFELRQKMISAFEAKGNNPYPHKFPVNTSIQNIREKYDHLQKGVREVLLVLAPSNRRRCAGQG